MATRLDPRGSTEEAISAESPDNRETSKWLWALWIQVVMLSVVEASLRIAAVPEAGIPRFARNDKPCEGTGSRNMAAAIAVPEQRFYRAQIVSRVDFAPDLWMVRVRAGGEFSFVPGQYATLGVAREDGKLVERAYSIVSAPSEEEVEFFFELVPEGALTPLIFKLQPGDHLSMRKVAKGKFSLDLQSGRKNHLLVSTVTGVAPFVSYVRTLAEQWKAGTFDGSHKLFLLNGASRPWEFGYREELARFGGELPWFTYIPTVSRPWDHSDWAGETGRADDILRKYADQWGLDASNTTAYLCGHPEMIEHSKAILRRRGFVDRNSVKEEVYWIPAHK